MTDPAETVYVVTHRHGRMRRMHTDRDCHWLNRGETIVEKPRAVLPADMPVCKLCSGEWTPAGTTDTHGTRKKLEDMEPVDLGLGRERIVTDGSGETPLPGQVRCPRGHLCSGADDHCRQCGAELPEEDDGLRADGSGAVDNDYDDSRVTFAEDTATSLDGVQTEPMTGGVAIDLVTRQLVFIRRAVAETVEQYYEREGFNLLTYKTHPYLPVRADDAVYEVVYAQSNPERAHKAGKTYDMPRGRLMHVPVEEAWQNEEGSA